MNPSENQSTPQQQTPQQTSTTELPPMPPPPFTSKPQKQPQTQQTLPIAPSSNTTTQPTSAPTGEFHVIGGPLYSLESRLPPQPNPLRVMNQPNLVPHPNRSGAMFEQVENRARTETWDDGYGDEEWEINEGYMGYLGGYQNQAFNRNQPSFENIGTKLSIFILLSSYYMESNQLGMTTDAAKITMSG
ncbi:uncharacterized protein LOC110887227 [Helianthus annuus]|uniref:uncharacterized protein LOC110887227 n=1 Tax=Helianthus annuus TaxID=4232 RepID=UPI000B8EF1A9|nr:uncharacterized protein LOC110887227 [Helianthus annuus]